MDLARAWLNDVVLVNESRAEEEPGDVSVFLSAEAALCWIEDWWVEDGQGSVFSASGERLVLGIGTKGVEIVRREPCAEGQRIVFRWLRARAEHMRARRLDLAEDRTCLLAPFEESGALPDTIEGLLAYEAMAAATLPRRAAIFQEPLWYTLSRFFMLVFMAFVTGIACFWFLSRM